MDEKQFKFCYELDKYLDEGNLDRDTLIYYLSMLEVFKDRQMYEEFYFYSLCFLKQTNNKYFNEIEDILKLLLCDSEEDKEFIMISFLTALNLIVKKR